MKRSKEYQAGQNARRQGYSLSSCPVHIQNNPNQQDWENGWWKEQNLTEIVAQY